LLFSLILSQARAPELKQVNSSYQWILNRLAQALAPLGEMQHEGICDLTWTGRKFSGNAQQRKQRFLLHHGTLLYDFPLTKISHYLKPPEREPEYRRQRSHDEFVANLSTNGETLRTFLLQEWQGVPTEKELPRERVQLLMDAKYGQTEWVFRR
jgi:lipoate-protein ligase A